MMYTFEHSDVFDFENQAALHSGSSMELSIKIQKFRISIVKNDVEVTKVSQ